ncbi:MAG: DUF1810 domain-containing protein [Actinomycetota bacterium]|nr:DUF1810 domain-containing protein [Actinomycetota bacterium]
MSDPDRLQRFVEAQDGGLIYETACSELRAGRKRSHWMWFVFPQLAGLGKTPTSQRYAIASRQEAEEYLAHPVLGPRLTNAAEILRQLRGLSATDVFGGIDAMKLRSSMTLFASARPGNPVFQQVLDAYFDGVPDEATGRLLDAPSR